MNFNRGSAILAFSLLLTSIAALPAAAEEESAPMPYAEPGFYGGIGIQGAVFTEVDDDLESDVGVAGADVNSKTATGFSIYAGYRIMPYLAAELEFEMFPDAHVDVELPGFDSEKLGEVETWVLMSNAKVFALTGRLQPFILFGIGVASNSFEDSVGAGIDEQEYDFAFRVGGGVDVHITELISTWARCTYLHNAGDVEGVNFNYVSFGAGLQLNF
jgi:opacity protein-like surface antigen